MGKLTTGCHRNHRSQLPRAERVHCGSLREGARQIAGQGAPTTLTLALTVTLALALTLT